MRTHYKFWMLLSVLFGFCTLGLANDVRIIQENGVSYRETTRTVQRPVTSVTMKLRQQTVYTERRRTEIHESVRTYFIPVTEYRYEPRWHGLWNPFEEAHIRSRQWTKALGGIVGIRKDQI